MTNDDTAMVRGSGNVYREFGRAHAGLTQTRAITASFTCWRNHWITSGSSRIVSCSLRVLLIGPRWTCRLCGKTRAWQPQIL